MNEDEKDIALFGSNDKLKRTDQAFIKVKVNQIETVNILRTLKRSNSHHRFNRIPLLSHFKSIKHPVSKGPFTWSHFAGTGVKAGYF